MIWIWVFAAIIVLVIAATIWFRWGSPDFAYGVGKRIIQSAIKAMIPSLKELAKPATPEELKRLDEGPGRSGDFKSMAGVKRPFNRPKEH